MRVFKAATLLLVVIGLCFSHIKSQSQTAPLPQNSTAPIQAPPDAAVVRAEVQEIETSLSKIPDRGAALFLLARRYAHLGELQKALALLKECVALDEGFDPADSPALQPLKSFPEFRELIQEARRRYPPVHLAHVAYTVSEKDPFPEGLAVDCLKHVLYMGSMHRKKIIRITEAGEISDFVKPDLYDMMPVGGVKVDPADHSVWAATDPGKKNRSELVHFDANGKLLERYSAPGPGPHDLNDLVLRHESEIYLSDTFARSVSTACHAVSHLSPFPVSSSTPTELPSPAMETYFMSQTCSA